MIAIQVRKTSDYLFPDHPNIRFTFMIGKDSQGTVGYSNRC